MPDNTVPLSMRGKGDWAQYISSSGWDTLTPDEQQAAARVLGTEGLAIARASYERNRRYDSMADQRLAFLEAALWEADSAPWHSRSSAADRVAEQTFGVMEDPEARRHMFDRGSPKLIQHVTYNYNQDLVPEDYDRILARPDAGEFAKAIQSKRLTPPQISRLLAVAPQGDLRDVIDWQKNQMSRADWKFAMGRDAIHHRSLHSYLPGATHPEYRGIAEDAIEHLLDRGEPNWMMNHIADSILRRASQEDRDYLLDGILARHPNLNHLGTIGNVLPLAPRHIQHFLHDGNPEHRERVLWNQPLSDDQMREVVNDPSVSEDDLNALTGNKNVIFPEDVQHRYIALGLGRKLILNKLHDLTPGVRQRLLQDPKNFYAFTRNLKLTDDESRHIWANRHLVDEGERLGVEELILDHFGESASPELQRLAWQHVLDGNHYSATALAANSNADPQLLREMVEHWKGSEFQHRISKAIQNPNFPEDDLPALLDWAKSHSNTDSITLQNLVAGIEKRLADTNPDAVHQESVGVRFYGSKRFGLGRLRQLRDLAAKKGGFLTREDLGGNIPEPIIKAKLLDGKGNLSADRVQAFIDSLPAVKYNISHAEWTGAQRHSRDQKNKVLQVNLTTDQVRAMRAAGVWGTFKKMSEASRYSSHPVTPHTIGWVRWSGNKRQHVFVDEIQSDFGQSFVRQAAAQAAEQGEDAEEATKRAEQQYPEEHYKAIKQILFQGRHPNEVLHQAFEQYLRDKGYVGKAIHMWHAEGKATISLHNDGDPIPGHMQETYRDIPEKHGYGAAKYGDLAIQDSDIHTDKPTLKAKLAKAEPGLHPDHLHFYGGRNDLIQTPPMAQCWLVGAEVDPFGTSEHPYIVQHPHGELYNLDADPHHVLESHWRVEMGKYTRRHYPSMDEVVGKLKDAGYIGHYGHHAIYPGAVTLYEPAALLQPESGSILERHLAKAEKMDPRAAIAAVQQALHSDPIPEGHAAVAAETLWHLLGGKSSGYVPMAGHHEDEPHWWLVNQQNPQDILDPSLPKFSSPPDYTRGKPTPFLSGDEVPGPRAQMLLEICQAPKEPIKLGKFEQDLNEFLGKSIAPTDLKDLLHEHNRSTKLGANLTVDHTPHLGEAVTHYDRINDYQSAIIHAPARIEPANVFLQGLFQKKLFISPDTGHRYMLKPYHDRWFQQQLGRCDLDLAQGWSEMAHQACYHAGGIGALHSLVHTDQHDAAPEPNQFPGAPGKARIPFVVVSFDPHVKHHATRMYGKDGFADQFDRDSMMHQAAKIGVMDFLAHNTDRHDQNLLVGKDAQGQSRVLAIDHSFCFQYPPHTMPGRIATRLNNVFEYVDPHTRFDRNAPTLEAAKWWVKAKDYIAGEFVHRQLPLIRDAALRGKTKLEFESRHAALTAWAQAAIDPKHAGNPHLPLVLAGQAW